MCTLMEKDVLMEEVSATTAYIAYRTPKEKITEDLKECSKLHHFLLETQPEDINFDEVINILRRLKEKYLNLPMYPYYIGVKS